MPFFQRQGQRARSNQPPPNSAAVAQGGRAAARDPVSQLPKEHRRSQRYLDQAFGPEAALGDINTLAEGLAGSPFFQAQLQQIARNTGGFQEALAGNLQQSGMRSTGVGNIAQALGTSYSGAKVGEVRGEQFGQAQQMGMQLLIQRLAASPAFAAAFKKNPSGAMSFLKKLAGIATMGAAQMIPGLGPLVSAGMTAAGGGAATQQ